MKKRLLLLITMALLWAVDVYAQGHGMSGASAGSHAVRLASGVRFTPTPGCTPSFGNTFRNIASFPGTATTFGSQFPGSAFSFPQANNVGHSGNFHHLHHRFGDFAAPLYTPLYPYVPLFYGYGNDYAYDERPTQANTYDQNAHYEPPDYNPAHALPERLTQQLPPQADQPAPATQLAQEPALQEPTLLVFRDGHQLEVRNYAIVGQMLYDLDVRGRKIQLADLDLEATQKQNEDRGIEFRLPGH